MISRSGIMLEQKLIKFLELRGWGFFKLLLVFAQAKREVIHGFGGTVLCNSHWRSGSGGAQPGFMADVPERVLLLPLWRRRVLVLAVIHRVPGGMKKLQVGSWCSKPVGVSLV